MCGSTPVAVFPRMPDPDDEDVTRVLRGVACTERDVTLRLIE
jgi:hypothetical protein